MDLIATLRAMLGPAAVLSAPAQRARYARDGLGPWRGAALPPALPDAVVRPASAAEVAAVLHLASTHGVPVVAVGGATGLMGGAMPVRGGLALDLRRLNRLRAVSRIDLTADAEAGLVLGRLARALRAEGLHLGHDPWTLPVATVGGAIATNGIGYLGGKYGSAGDQVLGLEVALADGTLLRTRPAVRASAGYDLRRLFVGSEGTLGIITAATLRVFPQPERRVLRGWSFPEFAAGFAALLDLHALGLQPALLDYGEEFGPEVPATCTLFLGWEGYREEVQAALRRATRQIAARGGTPLPQGEAGAFWRRRHVVAQRLRRRRQSEWLPPRTAFDFVHVALPPSAVLDYRARALAALAQHCVAPRECGLWTHPGLFSVVLAAERDTREEASAAVGAAVDELLRLAQDLGGAMEYCHGVGLRLAHLMAREHGAGLALMHRLKQALDPAGILNPGKLGLDLA
ncbi:MAG: FAD-binding oxidoreductase [Chloroflexi bacterium]|nr:FAD-binding oxidoreductase [Chloroflexota bacterium]